MKKTQDEIVEFLEDFSERWDSASDESTDYGGRVPGCNKEKAEKDMEDMCDELHEFCEENNLPQWSADELEAQITGQEPEEFLHWQKQYAVSKIIGQEPDNTGGGVMCWVYEITPELELIFGYADVCLGFTLWCRAGEHEGESPEGANIEIENATAEQEADFILKTVERIRKQYGK